MQKVIGDGDVADFLHSCRTQEPAVVLQELPYAMDVERIPLVEEEFRSGVPIPFRVWIVDVEEQLVSAVIQQPLGFALVVSEPRICCL